MRKISWLMLLVLVLSTVLAACGGAEEETSTPEAAEPEPTQETVAEYECTDEFGCVTVAKGEKLRIATALVISGANETLGIDSQRGVEIAIDDKKEIMGFPIELVAEDGGCSAEGGQTAATKISSDETIVAVVGHNCSSSCTPAAPIYDQAGFTMISPSCTGVTLTQPDTHVASFVRTAHSDKVQGVPAAEFAYEVLGARKAATIHDGSPYAEQLQQVFADAFVDLGGEITAQEAVNVGDTDMRPLLTSIAVDAPDIIYYPIFIAEGGFITVQAKEISGLEDTILMGADGMTSPDFVEAAGDAGNGMYFSGPDLSFTNPLGQAFLEKHQEKYGEGPISAFHAHAYDAANIIFAAIEQVAVLDAEGNLHIPRKALRDAIYGTTNFEGITGTLTCDENGDCADPAIIVSQLQNNSYPYIPIWSAKEGMLGEAPAEGEDLLDEVMAAGKLVVSSDPNYAPQSFLNESGELDGFDVDVSKEVAKRLGVDIAFETPDWDLVVAGGWGGRWDISIGSMTPTVPRSEVLWFTDAYYYTPASLAVHKDNTDITMVEDLEGKKLGFGTATTYEDWLNGALDIMEGYGGGVFYDPPSTVDQNPYNTDSEAIQDLALGDGVRLDAVMSAAPTIQSAIDEGLPLKFVGTPAFFEPLVFALDKGRGPSEKMVAKLNEILADMHADGTLTDLSLEWYGVDITKVVEPGEAGAPEPEMAECEPATVGPLAGVDPRGVTIDWWHNHSGSREEQLLPLVDRFNSTNACGITVNPTNQGSYDDIRDKMNASIATGDLPGLVVGYQNDQAFYQLADGLVDLNVYVDDPTWGLGAEKEDFYPTFLQQSVHPAYDNQRLGFPPNRSMLVLYYNQTWLEELGYDGPPTTPDEFKEMSCAAAEANGDGTGGYILYLGASGVAGWTFAFGGDVLSDDGLGYVYNGPGTVEAMTFLKEMYDEGCAYLFTEGYPDPEFGARRAIFVTESSSGMPFYQTAIDTFAEESGREPDEWGVAAIPHTTDVPVQNIYGGDVMIPATTPEEQLAAWIFIKWYTSPEIQAEWVKISNYFPTRRATTDFLGDYVSENKQFGAALSLLPYAYYEPQLISYQSVRDAAEQAANAIIQGADIQSTLDDLTDEANELQAELTEE